MFFKMQRAVVLCGAGDVLPPRSCSGLNGHEGRERRPLTEITMTTVQVAEAGAYSPYLRHPNSGVVTFLRPSGVEKRGTVNGKTKGC